MRFILHKPLFGQPSQLGVLDGDARKPRTPTEAELRELLETRQDPERAAELDRTEREAIEAETLLEELGIEGATLPDRIRALAKKAKIKPAKIEGAAASAELAAAAATGTDRSGELLELADPAEPAP